MNLISTVWSVGRKIHVYHQYSPSGRERYITIIDSATLTLSFTVPSLIFQASSLKGHQNWRGIRTLLALAQSPCVPCEVIPDGVACGLLITLSRARLGKCPATTIATSTIELPTRVHGGAVTQG